MNIAVDWDIKPQNQTNKNHVGLEQLINQLIRVDTVFHSACRVLRVDSIKFGMSRTKTNLQGLQRNDRAMIRQICNIKPEDVATVRSSEILAKLELEDLKLILRERRLRWFGHVEISSGAFRTACDIQIDGRWGTGRPKLTWKKLLEKDCREQKLATVDPQERSNWRSGVRSAMRAASQLAGRGTTDVDDAPAPAP